MNRPVKVSVMITTYNLAPYIGEALDSVLAQKTDFPFEILVGDDGSTDGTIEIVEEYMERHHNEIFLYVMEREEGVTYDRIERASKNRLNLIRHAIGDYLIFLDGDDTYTDEYKLQKQKDCLERPENWNCVACGHNAWTYWSEDHKEPINYCRYERKIQGCDYWKYGYYFHSDTIMFRNYLKEGIPKTIPEKYYDDNIIMFCMLRQGRIFYLPDIMVNYRQVEGSSWNSVDEMEKCIINLLSWEVENHINTAFLKESVYRHLREIFYMWRNSKRVPEELLERYRGKFEEYEPSVAFSWITYHTQPSAVKFKMTAWLFWQLLEFVSIKIH